MFFYCTVDIKNVTKNTTLWDIKIVMFKIGTETI